MVRLSPPFWAKSFFFVAIFCFSLIPFLILAEKKVSVSEVVFDTPVEDIQWLGNDHQTVLCNTVSGRLYRSIDGGKNWIEISDVLHTVAAGDSRVLVESMIVSPVDKDIVVIVGRHHDHFRSDDAGKTFKLLDHAGSLHNFMFHPSRARWALLSGWTEGCSSKSKDPDSVCRHDLYVTKDLGTSYTKIASYVVQYAWGDDAHHQQDSIFYTHFTNMKGKNQPRTGGWSENMQFSKAANPSAWPERVLARGNKFLVSNGYIFVAKLLDIAKQTVELMVSTDGGTTFEAAKLPVELQEKSYTILDTSEGAVMLHVNHGHATENGINVGNIYISDAAGLRYSLSLPKNVRTPTGECEFDRIAALDGVYMANFRAESRETHHKEDDKKAKAKKARDDDDDDDDLEDEDEDEDVGTAVERRHRLHKRGKQESMVKTVISFDKGGIWSYLMPPKIDSRGKKIECGSSFDRPTPPKNGTAGNFHDLSGGQSLQNDCWLHLHGITNFHRYAPFYSVGNAVGLLMGTGNVGSSLRYEEDQVNTYLSRDGGLTWVEAHKGAFIYEYGDHGGLIVMADDAKKTNQVVFSWNEGQSWYDFDLGDEQINVDNIVIEPNSSSVAFLLYGSRGNAGVLYHLDFDTLGQPPCKGVWAADSVSSDYETWLPTDGRTGDNCILGRQMTFTRRKQTSECFNGVDFSRPVEKKNCTCTERDYECEYGFTRHIESLVCVPQNPELTQEGCHSSGIFFTDAYRKIPGDACTGGWTPSKVPVLCPANSPFSARAKFVLLAVVCIVGALGIATLWSEDPRLRAALGHSGVDSLSNAKYAVIGSAARFLDALDFHMGPNEEGGSGGQNIADEAADGRSNRRGFESTCNEDLEFIEAEQQGIDDVPPLLDFSSGAPSPGNGQPPARRGLQAATENVPRLLPPPALSNQHPVREFEML